MRDTRRGGRQGVSGVEEEISRVSEITLDFWGVPFRARVPKMWVTLHTSMCIGVGYSVCMWTQCETWNMTVLVCVREDRV